MNALIKYTALAFLMAAIWFFVTWEPTIAIAAILISNALMKVELV